jgi:nucleoside phosphorylase
MAEAPVEEDRKAHFLKVENLIAYDTSSAGVALACQMSKTSLLTIKAVSYQVGRDEQKLNYQRKGLEVMPIIGKIITKFLIEKESE